MLRAPVTSRERAKRRPGAQLRKSRSGFTARLVLFSGAKSDRAALVRAAFSRAAPDNALFALEGRPFFRLNWDERAEYDLARNETHAHSSASVRVRPRTRGH
jgi:hypothetical protein